jgi:hypothetical protein
MRCSSVVCVFQRVWGTFYRQGRSVERVGPISQVRPDQGVRPALWSAASRLGCSCSLLLRRLRVGSLGRFRPVWRLGGAVAHTPCRVMNRLRSGMPRIAWEWQLWWLIGRTSGPIDPSDPNLIHSIKLAFPWSISIIQVVPVERRCIGPGTSHRAGVAAPARVAAPGSAAVPSPCGMLVPIFPKMCTYPWKSQHNSLNFISTKNVHETCHILLSNPRFWWLNLCCKDRQQTPPS